MDNHDNVNGVFVALANPIRRRILERLSHGPASINALTAVLPMTRDGARHHLSVIEASGLVCVHKADELPVRLAAPAALQHAERWLATLRTGSAPTPSSRLAQRGAAPDPEALDQAFQALESPARRRILELLSRGPDSVTGLATSLGVDSTTARRHLRLLGGGGLVETERPGRACQYRIEPGAVRDVRRLLAELRTNWERRLGGEQPPPHLHTIARTFEALAHPTRLLILEQLRLEPASVAHVCGSLQIGLRAAYRQHHVLEASHLLRSQTEGRHRVYRITPDALQPAADLLAKLQTGLDAAPQADPPQRPTRHDLEAIARVCQALGNPRRLRMLDQLLRGPMSVASLAKSVSMSHKSAAAHVRTLEASGLVTPSKEECSRIVRIAPGPLQAVSAWIAELSETRSR